MGHTRLATLPDTAPWRRVVSLIADDGDAGAVARATTQAALKGFEIAQGDSGLAAATLLLTNVVLAARQPDFAHALADAGIQVAGAPDVFDVIGGFSDALDYRLFKAGGRTDLGEMAQLAAVESLAHLLGQRSASLYGTAPADVCRAAQELSTQGGFATLAHEFFSRLTQRFLTYHLGRELSNHVGGNGRFADLTEHTEFVRQMEVHCRETAAIVRDFAGGWYSKSNFLGGVTPAKARGFVSHALTKLRAELERRGGRDGQ